MKRILLVLGLLLGNIYAWHESYDCAHTFDWCNTALELRVGVAPTIWMERGDFSAVSCNATTLLQLPDAFIPLFKMPRFHSLFRVPWFIGGHFGYYLCDDQEVYAELNYQQARARTFTLNNLIIPEVDTIRFSLAPQNSYRSVQMYVGARTYWQDCWCDDLDFFAGFKFGLLHHHKVNFIFTTSSLIVPPPTPFVSSSLVLFNSSTVPSGGLHVGLQYNVGCNWTVRFTGEIVATCGPKTNKNIPFDFATQSVFINPLLAPNSFTLDAIGTELFFPITIGVNYNF